MGSRGVRFRITAVASSLVGLVLVMAGALLVVVQRNALTSTIDQALEVRADEIVAALDEGGPPVRFASAGIESFVQLVGANGVVIGSTPNLERNPPLGLAPPDGMESIRTETVAQVDDDVFRVLTRKVEAGLLYVGTTYDVVAESVTILIGSLAIAIPLVTVVLGVVAWWLVGRTLRPVELIRTEVASIQPGELERRVSRPGTDDEIDRLAATMNEMLDRLQSSIERERRFVDDASHELRTPLTRLRAELELGIRLADDSTDTSNLHSLLAEVLEMQDLVEDLLFLARADGGAATGRLVPVDLDDIIFEEARALVADSDVEIDLTRVSGAYVSADPRQIGIALRNVLQNSTRYAATRVTVALEEARGVAVLTVCDDGPGVSSPGHERMFDRFGRLDDARSGQTGGAGLGLAIAREIVERHGGTLELINPGSPGACFELRLPTMGHSRGA